MATSGEDTSPGVAEPIARPAQAPMIRSLGWLAGVMQFQGQFAGEIARVSRIPCWRWCRHSSSSSPRSGRIIAGIAPGAVSKG